MKTGRTAQSEPSAMSSKAANVGWFCCKWLQQNALIKADITPKVANYSMTSRIFGGGNRTTVEPYLARD
jgi:hypothetical protein